MNTHCPRCGKSYVATPEDVGRSVICAGCRQEFVAAGEAPLAVPPSPDERRPRRRGLAVLLAVLAALLVFLFLGLLFWRSAGRPVAAPATALPPVQVAPAPEAP